MQPSCAPRPSLSERFWSLAQSADRRARSLSVARRFRDIVAELDAVWRGEKMEPTAGAFLAELSCRASVGERTYLPPEHAGPLDERALVYSVGALLAEGLVDRRMPSALRAVLGRAGSADPARRFASLQALSAELEWFVITEQEGIVPLPAQPIAPRRLQRSTPAVIIHPRALIARARAAERDLETAVVPRLAFDPTPALRKVVAVRPRPRRRERLRSPRGLRLLGMALGLMVGSAVATAALMFVLMHVSGCGSALPAP